MTAPEGGKRPEGQGRQAFAPEPSQVLELLERLGAGERLVDAPISMGLSQEQARAMFFVAADIVRRALREAPPQEGRWLYKWIRRIRR
jgi:hypothetical protein